MAKRQKISDEKYKTIVSKLGWGDLVGHLLRKIYGLLTPEELVPMTSVCQWWRSLCVDTLFWENQESLQLSNLKLFLGERANSEKLLRGLQLVMDANAAQLRQQRVKKIKFPYNYNFYYEHLNFLAERLPKLKKAKIYCPVYRRPTDVTDVTEAIQKWEDLEHLLVGPFHNCIIRNFLPAIGRSCKNLSVLCLEDCLGTSRYRFKLDDDNALLIAKNLRRLRVLKLEGALIFKPGLQTFLRECELLVKLCFTTCLRVIDDLEGSFQCFELKISLKVEKVVADDCTGWSIDSEEKMGTPEEVMNHIWSIKHRDLVFNLRKVLPKRNGYAMVEPGLL
ncbi:hypothetical protein SLA2020_155210 [Shorea laevis]